MEIMEHQAVIKKPGAPRSPFNVFDLIFKSWASIFGDEMVRNFNFNLIKTFMTLVSYCYVT